MNRNQFKKTPAIKLLDQLDIVELIKQYINVFKKGQNYWALCPFHGDKNPSMCISPTKKIFKCFVCNAKGNAITFVMDFKKIGYSEAIKEIIKTMNINSKELNDFVLYESNSPLQKTYNMNKQAAFIYNRTLLNSENKDKLSYLLSRNLDIELIKKYQIGYAPKDKKYLFSIMTNQMKTLDENLDKDEIWTPIQLVNAGLVNLNDNNEYFDFFWDRILIPIFDEKNNIVGFSGRALNKKEKIKYINTKSTDAFKKENILFNLNNFDASNYQEVFVVEGYMDVFAFRKIGIENVVASMGTSFTNNQINLLKKYKNIKTIILCLDNDEAGYNATIELYKKLSPNNFNIFVVNPYNPKYKDIDELLSGTNKDTTLSIVNNLITFIEYVIRKTFNNKNINKKEKIIETKKIIELINNYGKKSLSLENEITLLSELSGFNIDDIKNNIKIKNNNVESIPINTVKYENINIDDLNKMFFSDFVFKKKSDNFLGFSNWKNIQLKEKEMKLFSLLPISTILSDIFTKYINQPFFQSDEKTISFLNLLLFYIRCLISKSHSINLSNLRWEIDQDRKNNHHYPEQEIIEEFLNNIEKKQKSDEYRETNINQQGISLIIDIYNNIYEKKKLEIIKSIAPDKWDQKRYLDIKHEKERKELEKRKNIIFGKIE